jgi:hypothetical protein
LNRRVVFAVLDFAFTAVAYAGMILAAAYVCSIHFKTEVHQKGLKELRK